MAKPLTHTQAGLVGEIKQYWRKAKTLLRIGQGSHCSVNRDSISNDTAARQVEKCDIQESRAVRPPENWQEYHVCVLAKSGAGTSAQSRAMAGKEVKRVKGKCHLQTNGQVGKHV